MVGVLEAAYRDCPDEQWGPQILEAAIAALGRRILGGAIFVVDGVPNGVGQRRIGSFRSMAIRGDAPRLRTPGEAYALHSTLPVSLQDSAFFGPSTATLASDALRTLEGRRGGDLRDNPIWRASWRASVGDAIGLLGHDGLSSTVVVSLAGPPGIAFPAARRRLWARVAAHLGSALRLRTQPPVDEALIRADGRVEHHERLSRAQLDRLRLLHAGRRWARSRQATPSEALQIWQGLGDGRWSLVDRVDSDGKVFVVARRNQPAAELRSTPLSAKQRAAVSLLSIGYSNKQAAYALGLSAGAVTMLLQRARLAWGLSSRAELVRAFHRALSTETPRAPH
ncbi:MAG: hypothetical protein JSR82_11975 [Verrucomicrobia bacterium]|nr:hypothetical protein [Verrucomicrobiota bacterium]